MNKMLSEINEIPQKGLEFLKLSRDYTLPLAVPYLGMGSSYFAPLAFKYMGIPIYPEMASEFYNYLLSGEKFETAVILSQSGRSSEALWCTSLFKNYVAVTNYPQSPLNLNQGVSESVLLLAGDEQYSSSKKLTELISQSGAYVITVEEPEAEENFSILHNMVPFNYMAFYLAQKLTITETFVVGGKVTEVE